MSGRFSAWLYDAVVSAAERRGLARRRKSLASGARGRVLEIGAGTGLQFRHYPPDVDVYAIDPDPAAMRRADRRRAGANAAIRLVVADSRRLPFPDATFDTAISALAFCTIPEPSRAAAEVRRVLRPSGRAYLLEHVRAAHRAVARVQELLTPIWCRLAGGCHLARRTADLLRDAGFDVEVRHAVLDGILVELAAQPTRGTADR